MCCGARARFSLFLLLVTVCLAPRTAGAQTTMVSNPTTLVFTPSADHDAVLTDGSPVVDHYSFDVYAIGASQPFQSTNIGKPVPGLDGVISYDFSSGVASWPLPGGNYEGRVAALGPTGTSLSEPSNPFTFDSCSYTVSPTSALLPADGGGTQVNVQAGASCGWNATSDSTWVSLSTTAGAGSATVVASVAPNTTTTSRRANLTVAGQAFTIDEQGAAPPPPGATAPSAPANPSPATGAANTTITPTLKWTDAGATSYTVRFGTLDPPPQVATGLTATSFAPGTLALATTYYWQVVAVNAVGVTEGPVWTFTTSRKARKR